jgi:hypothetical protein
MKKLTLTLDDELYQCARVEASTQGKSLSKYVSELIKKNIRPSYVSQLEAVEAFLNGPPLFDENDLEKTPIRRTELYDDALLHR